MIFCNCSIDPSQPNIAAEIHRVMIASYRVEADLLGVADFPSLRRTPAQLAESSSTFFGFAIDQLLAAVVELDDRSLQTTDISSLVGVARASRIHAGQQP